jgi:hypothetical protein
MIYMWFTGINCYKLAVIFYDHMESRLYKILKADDAIIIFFCQFFFNTYRVYKKR